MHIVLSSEEANLLLRSLSSKRREIQRGVKSPEDILYDARILVEIEYLRAKLKYYIFAEHYRSSNER